MKPFGQGGFSVYSNYSAILMGALAVHDFLVQVLIHNPERKSYTRMAILTYLLGGLAYLFMGFGSFAIVNRTSLR